MALPSAGPLVAPPGHPTGALPGLEALAGPSALLAVAVVAPLTAVAVALGAFLGRRRTTARIEDGERGFPGGAIECPQCAAGNERGYHYCRERGAELPDSVYHGSVGGGGTGDAGFERITATTPEAGLDVDRPVERRRSRTAHAGEG